MRMKCSRKPAPLISHCLVLIVAIALFTTGCNGSKNKPSSESSADVTVWADGSVAGEGSRAFSFAIVDQEGNETRLEIHTDKEIVGEALAELGLISGEGSKYGLYVETVNGITIDFDKDGKYWAFYINGEYAMTGVDATPITEGDSYSFKVE